MPQRRTESAHLVDGRRLALGHDQYHVGQRGQSLPVVHGEVGGDLEEHHVDDLAQRGKHLRDADHHLGGVADEIPQVQA